jgi:hypothetical protein
MINKWKQWAGVMAFALLIAGCSSTAHIEKDDTADFSSYKTFAWVGKIDGEKGNEKSIDLAEQKLKSAVNAELEKAVGWKEVKNNPDILLSYDVLVERTSKENSSPVYSRPFTRFIYNPYTRRYATIYYPSQFLGYERDERPIKEGTVTISMIDVKTDKMIWQGWSTDEVNSRNFTSKEIQAAVRSIFKKFDIAKN